MHISTLILPLLAAFALATPIEQRADECATTCKKTYTHCYNFCYGQQILNPGPCARLCNVRSCKEVSLFPKSPLFVFRSCRELFFLGPACPLLAAI